MVSQVLNHTTAFVVCYTPQAHRVYTRWQLTYAEYAAPPSEMLYPIGVEENGQPLTPATHGEPLNLAIHFNAAARVPPDAAELKRQLAYSRARDDMDRSLCDVIIGAANGATAT